MHSERERQLVVEAEEPTPTRWDQLIAEVEFAATISLVNPDFRLERVGGFEVVALRGRGGFGLVFEARDPELDRRVALKLCKTAGPESAEALMIEARLLARLSHPNVVTVLELGRQGDDVFFAMEYVEHGRTAREFAKQSPSWEQIVDVYRGAGRGLAAAHDAGIVHRDFKPSNILLDHSDWPLVGDFGLARLMLDHASEDEREKYRSRSGTRAYMAPELLRGRVGDARSDQWSFCVSLWETLERTLPFEGLLAQELLDSIEHEEPRVRRPDEVPEAVRRVVRVGLSVDPAERYPDMHALLAELDALRHPRALPPPPAPPSGGSSWVPIVALLIALGSTLAVLGWLRMQNAPQQQWRATGEDGSNHESRPGFEFPCALGPDDDPAEVRAEVVAVCHEIRQDKMADVSRHWHDQRGKRLADDDLEERRASTARETLIVARTFVDRAEALEREAELEADETRARQLRARATTTMHAGELWLDQADDVLGTSHLEVVALRGRIDQ